MSLQARQELVDRLVFQKPSQRSDLLDPQLTQTGLIALLLDVTEKFGPVEITAVRSDHRDDSALGLHCHANGYCVDCWPLRSQTAGDYVEATSIDMEDFLVDASRDAWLYQIGLAGAADTPANRTAAGSTVFEDSGGDHVHLGAQ